ncbi:MAG: LicD family protein [Eubacteriales bacterium]|nr:LicD family protein [Eubacteriales bacterium]
MEQYDLTRVHEANLKMLKEIDRICRKYKIRYMLESGTLLGAVRHQGFIPWDDDVDVAFTRKNYEAFIKVVRRELPESMELVLPSDFQGGRGFYDFTARIIYKNSRVHEDSPETQFYGGKLNHLWVDLFTIDELPAGRVSAALTKLLQVGIYSLAMGHRYRLDYSRHSLPCRLAMGICCNVGRLIPLKAIFRMQLLVSKKDGCGRSNLRYYSNYQPDFMYVTIQREWCEEIIDMDFCGTKLMAPKHWHELLTWLYGDYMTLPPKEKRVPAHSTIEIQVYDEEV